VRSAAAAFYMQGAKTVKVNMAPTPTSGDFSVA